ncbi:hypothetical protein [uncultured Enterovirga sp.]|uniref:hypothetical protein n=1 Tax=uncultured Enterovirga sp. TaxID=2026352 RepID=UPI0035CC5CD0
MAARVAHQSDIQTGDQEPGRVPGSVGSPGNPADVAEYVAEFTKGLARLARSSKLDLLAYLLDVAHLEARTVLGNPVRKRRDG